MPKYLTSSSPNKKAKYADGTTRVAANKARKMKKHLKKYPNDLQTATKV